MSFLLNLIRDKISAQYKQKGPKQLNMLTYVEEKYFFHFSSGAYKEALTRAPWNFLKVLFRIPKTCV